jgi:quercetin dioxygenase-like cupin family protein
VATGQLTGSVPAQQAAAWAGLAGRLGLDGLPARDLGEAELQDLVATIAADSTSWAHLVGFDDERRVYALLHRDAHVDVWLLCWTPDNDTGWHDHDISSGAVAVVSGTLIEHNLRLEDGGVATRVEAGQVFSFGPDHIHRLTGATDDAVSVHAYSPPLWRLGQYDITDDGLMRRQSVSYADELRPIV